jgi:hypothetical protein
MYKIIGTDQKEYGPVTEEQVRQWITEGRANGDTLVRFESGPWKKLSTFPEFASNLPPAPPAPPPGSPPPYPTEFRAGAPTNNSLAVAGLVLSILGLFCCGPLFSTLGLIFSAVGLSQINREPMRYTGKGLALAGIFIALAGYVAFAILFFTGVLDGLMRNFPRP